MQQAPLGYKVRAKRHRHRSVNASLSPHPLTWVRWRDGLYRRRTVAPILRVRIILSFLLDPRPGSHRGFFFGRQREPHGARERLWGVGRPTGRSITLPFRRARKGKARLVDGARIYSLDWPKFCLGIGETLSPYSYSITPVREAIAQFRQERLQEAHQFRVDLDGDPGFELVLDEQVAHFR